jgi:hypothetical protein
MTPHSTNARRKIDKFAFRSAGRGARIRNLCARELSKSGLASHFGPQTCDFVSNSGGGTTAGAPTCTQVRPSRNQCTAEALSKPPMANAVGGTTDHSRNKRDRKMNSTLVALLLLIGLPWAFRRPREVPRTFSCLRWQQAAISTPQKQQPRPPILRRAGWRGCRCELAMCRTCCQLP